MGTVLSVIGAVLVKLLWLVLLLILLLILLVGLLLVWPIRYKGRLEYQESLAAKGRVSWLLGLLSWSVSYQEGEMDSRIRIFGVDFQRFIRKRRERKAKKGKHQKTKRKKSSDTEKNRDCQTNRRTDDGDVKRAVSEQEEMQICQHAGQEKEESGMEKAEGDGIKNSGLNKDKIKEDAQEAIMPEKEISQIPKKNPTFKKLRIGAFLKRWKEWFCYRLEQIQAFFRNLCSVLKKIKRKAQWLLEVKEFWQLENTRRMVCILKDNVIHLGRKLKPKVLRGKVIFGAGDPCTTGQILGAAAMLYAVYGKGVRVIPDFEEARLEGELYIRGRISIITILIILIRIFLSGEWNQFRREAEQLKEAL